MQTCSSNIITWLSKTIHSPLRTHFVVHGEAPYHLRPHRQEPPFRRFPPSRSSQAQQDHTPSGHWPGFGPRPSISAPRSPGQGKRAAPMRGNKWHPCGGGLKEKKIEREGEAGAEERKPDRPSPCGEATVHSLSPDGTRGPVIDPPPPPIYRSRFTVGRERSRGRTLEEVIVAISPESARFHRMVWVVFFFCMIPMFLLLRWRPFLLWAPATTER